MFAVKHTANLPHTPL